MSIENKTVFLFNQGEIGKSLGRGLKKEFTIYNADSDVEVLKILNAKTPHLILLNVKTIEYGSVIIDMITSNKKFNKIPIIAVLEDLQEAINWYDLGVLDCIPSTINTDILIAKINAILGMHFAYLSQREQNDILKLTNLIDVETGLFNKKYLMTRVTGEISRGVRQGEAISFIIVNIDDFKVLSDTYGKDAKDFVLKQTISMVKQVVRLSDVVIRYGESEIGVLCPITDRVGLDTLVEKLRALIDRNVFQYNTVRIKTSVSIGAYCLGTSDFNSLGKKSSNIFAFAEEALLRAKNNENKVEFFD